MLKIVEEFRERWGCGMGSFCNALCVASGKAGGQDVSEFGLSVIFDVVI